MTPFEVKCPASGGLANLCLAETFRWSAVFKFVPRLFNFSFPTRVSTLGRKCVCVCVCIYIVYRHIYTHLTVYRLYMNYLCYQLTCE